MKITVILLFLLVIIVVLYILNKMNTNNFISIMGGAYFDKTYKIEGTDRSKRPEKFRYDDTKPIKEKDKEYKEYIKEINTRPLDINFKLRFITNLLMNTVSYKDGTRILDNLKSYNRKMICDKKEFISILVAMKNITSLPDTTIFDYIKDKDPSIIDNFNKYFENPNNTPAQIRADSFGRLFTSLCNAPRTNPLKKDICELLGINDFITLKSFQSYHNQPASKCQICGLRSFVPGIFEESSDDSIKNAYNIRKLLKSIKKDMTGISTAILFKEHPIITEMPINIMHIGFELFPNKNFIIQVFTNKNVIKGAPFIINNIRPGHMEPFFINANGESTDATELKTILNSSTDDIPKYIDTLHQYASKNSLSMIYRENLKDLQRTFDVDVKNEKKILKQAYKRTMDRINS